MKTFKFYLLTIIGVLVSLNCFAQQNYDFEENGIFYKVCSVQNLEVEVVQGDTRYSGHINLPQTTNFQGKVWQVTTVGNGAFQNCFELTSIDLNQVKYIGDHAFESCRALTSIDLTNVETIGDYAFDNCEEFTSIDLKNVKSIGYHIFCACYKLKTINLGNISELHGRTFQACSDLESIDLKNVTKMGSEDFDGCRNLKTVKFGKLYEISQDAFRNCSSLKNIDFGQVENISYGAFQNCVSIDSIDFKHVRKIRGNRYDRSTPGAFEGCTGLQSISCGTAESIEERAFKGCSNLSKIDLKNVKEIRQDAFLNCNNITSIKTYAKTPAVVDETAFEEIAFLNAALEVPAGRRTIYSTSDIWKRFINITERAADEGRYPLTIKCDSEGSVQFEDHYITNGIETFDLQDGQQITLAFIPQKTYKINTVTLNGKDVTKDIINNRITLSMDMPYEIAVTFEKCPMHWLNISVGEGGQIIYENDNFISNFNQFEVVSEQEVTLLLCPYENYELSKVYVNEIDITDQIHNNILSVKIDKDTRVYAIFKEKAKEYRLYIKDTNNTKVYLNGEVQSSYTFVKIKENDTLFMSFEADEGYELSYVHVNYMDYTDKLVGNSLLINVDRDIDIEAISAARISYHCISVTSNQGGTVGIDGKYFSNGCTMKTEHGNVVEVELDPLPGYSLEKVLLNEEDETYRIDGNKLRVEVQKDVRINAFFKRDTRYYEYVISKNQGGVVYINGEELTTESPYQIEENTKTFITFEPKEGYHLSNVLVDGFNENHKLVENSLTITADNNHKIEVEFRQDILYADLSFISNDELVIYVNGNYNVNNIDTKFELGSELEISFSSKTGAVFSKLFINGQDVTEKVEDQRIKLTLNDDTRIFALFEKDFKWYDLTIKQADSGYSKFKVKENSTLDFQITPEEGWKINTVTFNDQDVTGELDYNNNFTTPTITENSTLNVSFETIIPSAIHELNINGISVYGKNNHIIVNGTKEGSVIDIYDVGGARIAQTISNGYSVSIEVPEEQVYIIKVGSHTYKLSM